MSSTFLYTDKIGQRGAISNLEDNLKRFLDWSFLNINSYIDVKIPTSGLYSNDFHKLKAVSDPSQTTKVWESPRKDWVYETGVGSPIEISGLYLNNTFLPAPTGSGNYGYTIDYRLGRINFNRVVSSTSKVEMEYSYRYLQTYKANESSWWKEVQQYTYSSPVKPNGDNSITANHRMQLPAIMIETIPRNYQIPSELGSSENHIVQDVFLHIFAENPTIRSNLIDILLAQKDNYIYLHDITNINKDNKSPLDKYGQINPSGQYYGQIYDNPTYIQNQGHIINSTLSEMNNLSNNLFNAIIRWSLQIFK